MHPYRDTPRTEPDSSRSSDRLWSSWFLVGVFVLSAIRVAVAWAHGERFGFEVATASAIVAAGVDRKLRSLGRRLDRGPDLDD